MGRQRGAHTRELELDGTCQPPTLARRHTLRPHAVLTSSSARSNKGASSSNRRFSTAWLTRSAMAMLARPPTAPLTESAPQLSAGR